MTGPVALKAAYIVTWVILLGYLGSLLRRFRRVREEMKDLKRGGFTTETQRHRDTEAQRRKEFLFYHGGHGDHGVSIVISSPRPPCPLW